MQTTVHVEGTPRAQPRARHIIKGRAVIPVSTADEGVKLYQAKVRQACAEAVERLGDQWKPLAVEIELSFYFGTKALSRFGYRHTAKPDADNLAKLIMDQATKAKLIPADDCRVSDLIVRKRWARDPGMLMVIRAVDPVDLSDTDDDIGAYPV